MSATIGTFAGAADLRHRGGGLLVGARDADDVGAGIFQTAGSVSMVAFRVRGRRVGHRLDGDRRIATDEDVADANLTRLASRDGAPGAEVMDVLAHGAPGSADCRLLALYSGPVKAVAGNGAMQVRVNPELSHPAA